MSQPRNPFNRLEDFLSGAFEGIFQRVFPGRLQPIELSHKLERAMDENIIVSANRRLAPNNYELTISADDFARFAAFKDNLLDQLRDALIAAARKRGYTLTSRPRVTLTASPNISKGDVRILTSLLDAAQLNQMAGVAAAGPHRPAFAPPDGTQVIAPAPPPDPAATFIPGGAPAGQMPFAALVMRTTQGPGQTYAINREIIHIGRHTSNDIVINDRRISRYHAEVRFERGQFVIYDLGSLNGVVINGAPTRQGTLRNGDIVTFGNYSFVFERR